MLFRSFIAYLALLAGLILLAELALARVIDVAALFFNGAGG